MYRTSPLLQKLLKEGKNRGVFPAAAASVITPDKIHLATVNSDYPPLTITKETLFDLASLTKPLVIATLLFQMIEKGKISFHTKLGELYPRSSNSQWGEIPLINYLNHSSGLIGYKFLFLSFIKKGRNLEQSPDSGERLIDFILKENPAYPQGKKSEYSDFGYILLGKAIETFTRKNLQEIISASEIWGNLKYNPPLIERRNIPPAEILSYRGGTIQGEVHDEHAFLMGGISGHAGLFGSLKGVSDFVQKMIKSFESDTIISTSLFKEILKMKIPDFTWLPGWDTPSKPISQGGRKIGGAIGHLGYTGCSIWIELEKRRGVVLLSNRTFPSRFNQKIKKFRPYFHDEIWEKKW